MFEPIRRNVGSILVNFQDGRNYFKMDFAVNVFQTKRWYSAHGQRIAWVVYKSGVIFHDKDRMISQYLENCAPDEDAILDKYDRCEYSEEWDEDVNKIQMELERWCIAGPLTLVSLKGRASLAGGILGVNVD